MTDHEPFQREPQNPQDPQVVVFSPELLKLADRRRQALEDCRQAAEDGDANAVVQMGMNCLYGIGGAAKDPGKAFRWFSQTAPDDPAGLYWLGVLRQRLRRGAGRGPGLPPVSGIRRRGLRPGSVQPGRVL